MSLTWYCLRTERHREEIARDGILALDRIIVRLPIFPTIRGRGDDRKRVDIPLIARHLFVGFGKDEDRFAKVKATRGVVDFLRLGAAHEPVKVRIADMARLDVAEGELVDAVEARLAAYRDEALRRARKLAKGREPDDTDELIERLKSTDPDQRAIALYEMLGRGSKARLSLAQLQNVA